MSRDLNAEELIKKAQSVKFSQEDMRILNECGRESFYQRCIPFSTLFGMAAHAAVKSGYTSANPRWGSIPKVLLAVGTGYILGKFSYRDICAKKLMESPNSEVGQLLRESRNPLLYKNLEKPVDGSPFFSSAGEGTAISQDSSNSSLNLDIDRPLMSMEDTYQSPLNAVGPSTEFIPPVNPAISYDDMRKMNRESHTAARAQPYKQEETFRPGKAPTDRERKNIYGDVIN